MTLSQYACYVPPPFWAAAVLPSSGAAVSEALLIQSSIARRYARALFEAMGPDFERASDELAGMARAFDESSELRAIFTDPRTDKATRDRVIESIITAGNFHPMVANALRLLNDRERMAHVPMMARVYGEMVDRQSGRIRAKVTSAAPLTPDLVGRLQTSLTQATRKNVVLETAEDSSLLGGVVAQVGNVVYDGSLRTQLESLRRELTERA